VAIFGIGVLPVGDVLLRPLETRFPIGKDLDKVDGIIVLGGGEDLLASRRFGQPQLGEGADRYIAAVALAQRYPEARLLFAGGSGRLRDLSGAAVTEAEIAKQIFQSQGIAPKRMLFETRSRNTTENARLGHALARPAMGEHWILITSAFHMPRAFSSFKAAGWQEIEPYPVDFRTWHWSDGLGWNFERNLRLTNTALREWVGRLIYGLAGR
jgi:uncharacterized SAM-binding protein YcdF (DUF218 family)